MSKKLPPRTPWFDGSVKPAREGVFETEEPNGDRWFNLFKHGDWHMGWRSTKHATYGYSEVMPSRFLSRWRGLTKEAK